MFEGPQCVPCTKALFPPKAGSALPPEYPVRSPEMGASRDRITGGRKRGWKLPARPLGWARSRPAPETSDPDDPETERNRPRRYPSAGGGPLADPGCGPGAATPGPPNASAVTSSVVDWCRMGDRLAFLCVGVCGRLRRSAPRQGRRLARCRHQVTHRQGHVVSRSLRAPLPQRTVRGPCPGTRGCAHAGPRPQAARWWRGRGRQGRRRPRGSPVERRAGSSRSR